MKFTKSKIKIFIALFLAFLFLVFLFQINKPLPFGLSMTGETVELGAEELDFLYDLTYLNEEKERVSKQQIFPEIFSMIELAEEYILIDMFLFNSFQAKSSDEPFRPLADELTKRLIAKKQNTPEIKIDFITDPLNTVYGGGEHKQIEQLKQAGINVVITDLRPLRDSNPLYSVWWRTFLQWWGNSKGGFMDHPFSSQANKVSLRSYLTLLNFKANHRKVILADNQNNYSVIVTSANPHDGSSAHSNVALKISGDFWKSVYVSEQAVAKMSGQSLQEVDFEVPNDSVKADHIVKLVTEGKIKEELMRQISSSQKDDEIFMAMFYLADSDIINSLIKAAKRGVQVRLVLDPNKDAFGYEKNGVPNRPVAHKMIKKSQGKIQIRWYDTHGEQFHSKLTLFDKADGQSCVILGSANLTRRNLGDYNLESNVSLEADSDSDIIRKIKGYTESIWYNQGQDYTLDYSVYQDDSWFKNLMYIFQEKSGLSSF